MVARAGARERRASVQIVALACVLALTLAVSSCGRDQAAPVPREAFQTRLADRVELTRAQARCATDQLYDHYGTAEIRVLYRRGLGGLPTDRWTFYLQSLVGCSLGAT